MNRFYSPLEMGCAGMCGGGDVLRDVPANRYLH